MNEDQPATQPAMSEDWRAVHAALHTLYDIALEADAHQVLDATRAYAVLIEFIASVQFPDSGVEPERLKALCRLLVDSGDMTPYARMKFDQILDGEG